MKEILFKPEEAEYIKRMIAPCTDSKLKKSVLSKLERGGKMSAMSEEWESMILGKRLTDLYSLLEHTSNVKKNDYPAKIQDNLEQVLKILQESINLMEVE